MEKILFDGTNSEEIISKLSPFFKTSFCCTHDWTVPPGEGWRKEREIEELTFDKYPRHEFEKAKLEFGERIGRKEIFIQVNPKPKHANWSFEEGSFVHLNDNLILIEHTRSNGNKLVMRYYKQ